MAREFCYLEVQISQQETKILRVREQAGVDIQKFMLNQNGEKMSEHGLGFGMKLQEETDMVQNTIRNVGCH